MTSRVLGSFTQAFDKWRKASVLRRYSGGAHPVNTGTNIHADDPTSATHSSPTNFSGTGLPARGEPRRRAKLSGAHLVDPRQETRLNRRTGPPSRRRPVQGKFIAQTTNQLWLADITEHRTDERALRLHHQGFTLTLLHNGLHRRRRGRAGTRQRCHRILLLRYSNGTSATGDADPPEPNYAWRPSPGASGPTIDAAKAPSSDSTPTEFELLHTPVAIAPVAIAANNLHRTHHLDLGSLHPQRCAIQMLGATR